MGGLADQSFFLLFYLDLVRVPNAVVFPVAHLGEAQHLRHSAPDIIHKSARWFCALNASSAVRRFFCLSGPGFIL